ncbi:MAG: DUF4416 family protein [Candidatus Aureabacteria bacterium]|nr:DUF4416 family protein [Candidatus Auribacterota bacterium]
MGNVAPFQKEKLIMSILFNPKRADAKGIKDSLKTHWGEFSFESPVMPFHHTKYYENEMGSFLDRFFVCFLALTEPDSLSEIKIRTTELEKECFSSPDGNRYVNLDPGLLSPGKLILASTKNYSHRIPLKNGIYAEVTMMYEKKEWRDLPWTYPDYKTTEIRTILSQIRSL